MMMENKKIHQLADDIIIGMRGTEMMESEEKLFKSTHMKNNFIRRLTTLHHIS